MKKNILFLAVFAFILIAPLAAAEVTISKDAINNVIVKEIPLPAEYEITITNDNSYSDSFRIDSYLDLNIYPKSSTQIGAGESKTVTITIYPGESITRDARYTGTHSFNIYVKGYTSPVVEDGIVIKIIPASDVLDITYSDSIKASDKSLEMQIKNNINTKLDFNLSISSILFDKETPVILEPYESKTVTLDLDEEDLMREAGTYSVTFSLIFPNGRYDYEKSVLLESFTDISTDTQDKQSTFGQLTEVTKKNNGNIPTTVRIDINRSAFGKIFSSKSIAPDFVKKVGNEVIFSWERELQPQESFVVRVNTDYLTPLLALIIIIIIAIILNAVFKPVVFVEKKLVKARTKTGHFASKIILHVKNKGPAIKDVKIIERLPPFTELVPERFGTIAPSEIKKSSIIWNIPEIAGGEEVIVSYIVYSKVSIIGKLTVPPAIVTYQAKNGNLKEQFSNSLYILAEHAA